MQLELKKRLARLLVEKSYKEGSFLLASGRQSDYYFDCRITALDAEGSWLIGNLFYDLLSEMRANGTEIKGVGGMTMGYGLDMAEHSICQPGRPLPQGLSQYGSPGFALFHRAKSMGSSFSSPTATRAPACMSSRLRCESLP